jgi:hypothetical protein
MLVLAHARTRHSQLRLQSLPRLLAQRRLPTNLLEMLNRRRKIV